MPSQRCSSSGHQEHLRGTAWALAVGPNIMDGRALLRIGMGFKMGLVSWLLLPSPHRIHALGLTEMLTAAHILIAWKAEAAGSGVHGARGTV